MRLLKAWFEKLAGSGASEASRIAALPAGMLKTAVLNGYVSLDFAEAALAKAGA